MIRIDAMWLATSSMNMRAGPERLLARVVQVFGAAQAHHGYPQLKIVRATAWVRRYGCLRTAKNLRPGLRSRFIGATFHAGMDEQEFAAMPRGLQVWNDVLRRRPRDWLALDDDGWTGPSGAMPTSSRRVKAVASATPRCWSNSKANSKPYAPEILASFRRLLAKLQIL